MIRESPGTSAPVVECTISLTLHTLNGLFVGVDTIEAAIAKGALLVRPVERVADATTFLRLVTLGASWYSPLADDR